MSGDQLIVFGTVGAALVLFVTDILRYDVVALIALLVLVLTGVVPADQAFSGFADPVVTTVATVLVMSAALRKSGLMDLVARRLEPVMRTPSLQVAVLVGLVMTLSAFINNVGALAAFLPIAMQLAYRARRPPAQLLMPLSFASLLGGTITLIGTPPNLIIASIREQVSGQPFDMFDFAPVGLAISLAGLVFLAFGWRLLPRHRAGQQPRDMLFRIEDYVTEVRVPQGSALIDKTVRELEALGDGDLQVVAIIREDFRRFVPSGDWTIRPDDILVIQSESKTLQQVIDSGRLELVGAATPGTAEARRQGLAVVEAVITPDSPMVGRSATELQLRGHYGIGLLAVSRRGENVRVRLRRLKFRAGDVVLLQGRANTMTEMLDRLGCLPLAERDVQLGRPRRLYLPAAIMAGAVLLTSFDILPVAIAFLLATLLIVLFRLLTLAEVYAAIEWPVLILLGAMIPVSEALQSTGGTALIAGGLSSFGLSGVGSLALILVVTMLVTPMLNNAATVLVMAPIAVQFATRLGLHPDAFLMAVAIGASSDFLTPIGHQSNTLVMGPGGYKFIDYPRLGLPLSLIVVAVALPVLVIVWPL